MVATVEMFTDMCATMIADASVSMPPPVIP